VGEDTLSDQAKDIIAFAMGELAKDSGWKKTKHDGRGSAKYHDHDETVLLELERGRMKAVVEAQLRGQQPIVTVAIVHQFNLTNPHSIDQIRRALKITKKVNK
jgi:hypothetical protein